jgi:hypothetical protein
VPPRPGEAAALGLHTTRPTPAYLSRSAEPPVNASTAQPAETTPRRPSTTETTAERPTATPKPSPTAPASPARRRRLPIAIGVMAAILVAAAIVRTIPSAPNTAPGAEPGTEYSYYDVRGFLTLAGPKGVLISPSSTVEGTGDPECWGQSQYQDIGYGAVVTVFNDADQIVAYGTLEQGRASRTGPGGTTVTSCVFPILVHNVPTGSGFYQVQVAQRGTVMVPNEPENGVLYAFLGLDDAPGSLPKVADQPPKLPTSS